MEIRYSRQEGKQDVVVVLVPNLEGSIAATEEFQEQWTRLHGGVAQEAGAPAADATELPPAPDPCLLVTTKADRKGRPQSQTISLDGLLDYDDSDTLEETFEVSLFAELFKDMLHQRFGEEVLQLLKNLPELVSADKKRKRADKDDRSSKKPKAELEKQEEAVALDATAAAPAVAEEGVKAEEKRKLKEEELAAFQFFDRSSHGYVRVELLEGVLHSLGQNLSLAEVKQLLVKLGESSRCQYTKLQI